MTSPKGNEQSSRERESRLPLIGTPIKYIPGQELIMERPLDVTNDRFLAHHLFVNAKGIKPDWACMPVMPFAMSLELMAEISAFLAPGCGLLGFEKVTARKWLRITEETPLPLLIKCHVRHNKRLESVVIVKAEVFIKGESKPAISGYVLLGTGYQVTTKLAFSEMKNLVPLSVKLPNVYDDGYMFHGPLFQTIVTDPEVTDQGISGKLLIHQKSGMFRSIPDPDLLTDPLLIDGVAQLMGLWAMGRDRHVFPIEIEKFEFYRPTPPLNTRAPVRIEIINSNVRFMSGNVEVEDGEGNVWFRILGWKMWNMHWDKKLVDLRRKPTNFCASEQVCGDEGSAETSAQMIDKATLLDFDLKTLAGIYLDLDEMERFEELSEHSEDCQSWLLEIIVAKDVFRRWYAQERKTSDMLHPASFSLVRNSGNLYVPQLPQKLVESSVIEVRRTSSQTTAVLRSGNVDRERYGHASAEA